MLRNNYMPPEVRREPRMTKECHLVPIVNDTSVPVPYFHKTYIVNRENKRLFNIHNEISLHINLEIIT